MKYLWLLVLFVLAYWFMRSCQRPKENYCMCGG